MKAKILLSLMKCIFFILFTFPILIFAQSKINDNILVARNTEEMRTDTLSKSQAVKSISPRFRVGVQTGYAYRTAPIPIDASSGMKNHLSKLRNNLSYGANISYFFKKGFGVLKSNIGIGMKYSGTYTNVLSEGIPYRVKDNSIIYSMLSEKFETHYIGAFFETRVFLGKNKHCVFGNMGVGYIRYNNDAKIAYEDVKIIGNSAAFSAEIGYDFLITKNFAIGLQTSFILGFVNYLVDNIKPKTPQKENLSHLNITVGFRFYK